MRYVLVAVGLLLGTLGSLASAAVQVSVGFSVPGLTIGINLPAYPYLVLVPGYPVYYAPRLDSNYFFYDGLYWVFVEDNWYVSYWYNGPWEMVYPDYVPLFILRVPVYYYRWPPLYFRSWWRGGPPHWGERWGRDWEHRHTGWNQWDMSTAPAPAPLPDYQREYFGTRYPTPDRQRELHRQHYRYVPQDSVVRQHVVRREALPAQTYQPPRQERQQGDMPRVPSRDRQPEMSAPNDRREPRIRTYSWPSSSPDAAPRQWQERERVIPQAPVMIQRPTPETRYQRQTPASQEWPQERRVTVPEPDREQRAAPTAPREIRGGRRQDDRGDDRGRDRERDSDSSP